MPPPLLPSVAIRAGTTPAMSPAAPRAASPARVVTPAGTHDPRSGRVPILAQGLAERGLTVRRIVEPSWGSTTERVELARRGLGNPRLLGRLVRAYARLGRRVAEAARHGVILVGYPGQLDMVALRLLFPHALLVLDAFVGLDETLADRRIGARNDATRRAARLIDRLAFRFADLVVVDTAAHGRRFSVECGLDPGRVVVAPVGARDPGTVPRAPASPPLRVLYFGGFVPLHGLDTILAAARCIPRGAGVCFDLVGDGQEADAVASSLAADPVPNVRFTRTWLSEDDLIREYISQAHVCLGIFGAGTKAMDVVPAKLYLVLACGRTVATAESPALREEVLARSSATPPVLVCPPSDPPALASTLLRLRDDPNVREEVAAEGRRLYSAAF